MQKNILIGLLLVVLTGCQQKPEGKESNQSDEQIAYKEVELLNYDSDYLLSPESSDTMCINAIERAKIDLNQNAGVFSQITCFGCETAPYFNELKEVLAQKKFKLYIEDFGCILFDGQTFGCYSGYTDKMMKERFGKDYREQIIALAEKKFIFNLIKNDSIVSIYDLSENERPRLNGQNIALIDEGIMPVINTNLPLKQDSLHSLFIDLDFVIEKDGSVSNFEVSNWGIVLKENKALKSELFEAAVLELKTKYGKWIPGNYKGNVARTKNNLRAHFN